MRDWNLFRGNSRQTGYTDDPGPSRGEIVWKAPLGRQWYSPPLVEEGRIYQACPGRMGRKILCADLETGETVWEVVGSRETEDGRMPAKLRLSSRLVSSGDGLFARGLNNDGIYRVSKEDGSLLQAICGNGVLDYRTHPQPIFTGNEKHLVFPLGTTTVVGAAPDQSDARIWRHLGCRDTESGELLWSYKTGQFFSEPALDEIGVYVGTADGYLYCLDIAGKDTHTSGLGQAATRRRRWAFRASAPVNSSPALYDGRVYFGDEDGIVYCLEAAGGQVIWSRTVGPPVENAFIRFSKPIVAHGMLYIGGADGLIHRLDAFTGEPYGTLTMPDWIRARPAVVEDEKKDRTNGTSDDVRDGIVAASIDGTITRFAASGKPVWSRRLNRWHLTCDPVVAGSSVLVVTSDMILWCLDAASGDTVWHRPIVDYPDDYVAFDEYQSSPSVSDGRLFVGTPGHFLYALDADTGSALWRFETGGEVPCDPICSGGRVFFGQQGGESWFYCLEAEDGTVVWRQDLGRVWAAPNIMEGRLYVAGAEGTAYGLEADTGKILWRHSLGSDIYAAPAIYENLVYFGTWGYWLYAFDRITGEQAWKFDAETYLDSGAPAVEDGRLYLPTMGPRFYCLDAESGDVHWTYIPEKVWTTNASPAVHDRHVVMMVFVSGGHPVTPYNIETCCLDTETGEVLWRFPAGGLNGPTIARDKVLFGSTSRGDYTFYCIALDGNDDGTTECIFTCTLGFNVLESCTAVVGTRAYVYAEDGYLYAIE